MPKSAIRKWSHRPGSPLFMLHDPAPLILNGKDMGNPQISLDLTMKNGDLTIKDRDSTIKNRHLPTNIVNSPTKYGLNQQKYGPNYPKQGVYHEQ